jgi:hypothetical protein
MGLWSIQLKSYYICVAFQSAQILVGSRKSVAELAKYYLDLVEVQQDARRMALHQQTIIRFSAEMVMKIMK